MLRPLAKILLRNGISYGTFADLTKWVFVDVAAKDFAIKDRKQSTSRISVITVSMESGSGGSLVAETLAKRLSFDYFHRKIIKEIASE